MPVTVSALARDPKVELAVALPLPPEVTLQPSKVYPVFEGLEAGSSPVSAQCTPDLGVIVAGVPPSVS